jgi:hypothetical protein
MRGHQLSTKNNGDMGALKVFPITYDLKLNIHIMYRGSRATTSPSC